jgi:protein SCO1
MARFNRFAFLCALGLSILTVSDGANAGGLKRWGEGYFPNAVVYDQNGRALKFYDDVIKNKIVVVSFIFAKCHDLCPLTTARLAEVRHRLGDVVGRDVTFVSVSIDPENDTPEKLQAYAEPFDVGSGWLFLTGKRADIDVIRRKLGELSRTKAEHKAEVWLGNDRTGEWARDSAMSDPTLLTMNIRSMDPEWRNTPQTVVRASTPSETPMPPLPGVGMYRKLCMSCHTVGKGDRIGPDLSGVAKRRDRDWLIGMISDPDKLRQAKDATMMALMAKFKGTQMPNLGLSRTDAADLIAYLEEETHAIEAKKAVTGDASSGKSAVVQ